MAYHEAGHAVAALDAGGEFMEATMHHECVVGITLPNARRRGVVHMAGPEAELIETGADRGRPAHELQVRTGGDSARIGYELLDDILDRPDPDSSSAKVEAQARVQRATEEARVLMTARWAEVQAVAEALLEHERLDYQQVAQIVRAARGPTGW